MAVDLMPTIPSSYLKPNFGDNKCWFSSKWHDFVWLNKTLKPINCMYRGNFMHIIFLHYLIFIQFSNCAIFSGHYTY
jgi:hypothetical protein